MDWLERLQRLSLIEKGAWALLLAVLTLLLAVPASAGERGPTEDVEPDLGPELELSIELEPGQTPVCLEVGDLIKVSHQAPPGTTWCKLVIGEWEYEFRGCRASGASVHFAYSGESTVLLGCELEGETELFFRHRTLRACPKKASRLPDKACVRVVDPETGETLLYCEAALARSDPVADHSI